MSSELSRLQAAVSGLSSQKLLATGVRLEALPAQALGEVWNDFDRLVQEIYKWYMEDIRADVNFLFSEANSTERVVLAGIQQLVMDQRHVTAHRYKDAPRAHRWRSDHQAGGAGNSALRIAFLDDLTRAVTCLSAIAQRVARASSLALPWRDLLADTPIGLVSSVCADLGLRPNPQHLNYLVRQYEQHPMLKRNPDGPSRRNLAEAVVTGRELVRISVPYRELLDAAGLIAHQEARSFLLLAHSLEELGVRGNTLRSKISLAWTNQKALAAS